MLPKELQDEVWKEYVPGQEITKTPTMTYLNVMMRAIDTVDGIEQLLMMEREKNQKQLKLF